MVQDSLGKTISATGRIFIINENAFLRNKLEPQETRLEIYNKVETPASAYEAGITGNKFFKMRSLTKIYNNTNIYLFSYYPYPSIIMVLGVYYQDYLRYNIST